MRFYAVIDTNVIVSAVLSKNEDSATVKVLKAIFAQSIIPLYNDEIITEYRDVLLRKKFMLEKEDVLALINVIKNIGIYTERTTANTVFPAPDDKVFYEVALSKMDNAALLVTGNIKHYPDKDFVVTPAEMIKIIENS